MIAAFPPLVHWCAAVIVSVFGALVLVGLASLIYYEKWAREVAAVLLLIALLLGAVIVLATDCHSAPAPVTLSMTLPAYRANVQHSGDLLSVRCTASAERVSRVTGVRVWGRRQSQTWRDSLAARWTDPAAWRRLWSTVGREAADSLLVSVAYPETLSWRLPGTRVAYIIPDAKWSAYSVSVADSAGWSCRAMRSRP